MVVFVDIILGLAFFILGLVIVIYYVSMDDSDKTGLTIKILGGGIIFMMLGIYYILN